MLEDALLVLRLQFAVSASVHFMFVALTLGLAPVILITQLRATLSRDPARMRAVRFWGGLYVVNYGMGILSGLVMELQLATNWGGLNHVFGNVFSAPLAVETLVAFFVESTFLALWIFGWERMNRWAHLATFLVVTATAYASAYWVLVANGFLKNPVGFEMRDGVAVLTDATALLTNPAATSAFAHISFGALLLGGLFLAAVSSYHLRRSYDPDRIFTRGLRVGIALAALALLPTFVSGGMQFPMIVESVPPTSGDTLSPGEIERLEEGHSSYAPVPLYLMMLCWLASALLVIAGLLMWLARRLEHAPRLQVALLAGPLLPLMASLFGWLSRELGRQPWVVVHHLPTAEGATNLSPGMALLSFTLFTGAFAALVSITYWLLLRYARLGPDHGPLAAPVEGSTAPPPRPSY
ncbi:cytochrome ubiquinol oxidase subunit I [Lipingzhangella sp. LS1_29]|uniref:Cytochrome ubiquinol oxidase subunit I n=1 Tax=Lipingzhangella rawalii TaxID=2055835 RepID=A0ABU2H5H4_9ACTN|nr:cytochrome ubiquinol oxidase subunit I [Lipingzhangella rawalii]MDS1270556.1 cytochrome ubiquinol oxidase subunit I [Lipingzhangella rawalii]